MSAGEGAVAASAAMLGKLFEFSYNVTKQNVEGFSHEDSLEQPRLAGNCLNWVVGHIVATRSSLLKILGQTPVWSDEDAKPYERGSRPIVDGSSAMDWTRILQDLDTSQERLRAGLDGMSEEQLASAMPEGQNPFGLDSMAQMIGAFHFHEAYHAGQTGILRRVLGKPGVIN